MHSFNYHCALTVKPDICKNGWLERITQAFRSHRNPNEDLISKFHFSIKFGDRLCRVSVSRVTGSITSTARTNVKLPSKMNARTENFVNKRSHFVIGEIFAFTFVLAWPFLLILCFMLLGDCIM